VQERLQKVLAQAGYGSRRTCEALIKAGRIRINGEVAILGAKADPERDHILLDNQWINATEEKEYIALYKPRGVLSAVTSLDAHQTVREMVPIPGRLYPVGRLDADSEGLVLLTNDGELANQLTHPRYEHEKEYRVLVAKQPDAAQLATWRRGLVLEDGFKTHPADVFIEAKHGKGTWLRVILKEGHKRQLREMGKSSGLPVVKIIRVRIGGLRLGNLKPGEWRKLTEEEVKKLKSAI